MKKSVQKWMILGLLLATVLGLAGCGETAIAAPAAPASPTAAPLSGAAEVTPEIPSAPSPAPEPTPSPTPSPPPMPEAAAEPVYSGPDLAPQPRTDDIFFSDAAFFGNSLVRGLALYGGLAYGDFYAEISAAVYNVGTTMNATLSNGESATLLDALSERQYGKIYILLGINEIAFDADYFIELLSAMLDEIALREPEAEFYIMSLTPVTRSKSEDPSVFTEERVLEYNAALRALAERRQCWYVDLVDALAGPDGYLPEEISTDGIHLTKETYPLWSEYLRTHYAPPV